LKGILIGLVLVALCALIHAICMFLIGEFLIKRLRKLEGNPSAHIHPILLSSVFAMILLLHLGEITLWAVVYNLLGLFSDFKTSFDFSVGSYSTNSVVGIQLPGDWKLLGQLESIAGPLLGGLSTAFLFLVLRRLFEIRRTAHRESRQEKDTPKTGSTEFRKGV
jgi:hypothetical protein